MGLLDQVIGSVLGNVLGGGRAQGGGAMSPLVKALLMLLAAKAAQGGFGDILGGGERPVPRRRPEEPEPGYAPQPYDEPAPRERAGNSDNPYSDLSGMLDGPGGAPPRPQERPRDEVDNPFNPEAGPYGRLDREPGDEAPGGPLGGGLDSLIEGFRRGGLGDVIESWIGGGHNRPVQPQQLAQALGSDTVDTLSRQTGLGRDDLLAQLAQVLPGVVDGLTPQGRRPNRDEMGSW